MTRDQVFTAVLLALVGGVAVDLWLGPALRWRKALQAALAVLAVVFLLTLPGSGESDHLPEVEPPPYRF